MNTVSIIAFIFIALLGFLGYRRGLIKSIYRLCSFLIIIVATIILGRFVANWAVGNEAIYGKVYDVVSEKVTLPLSEEGASDALIDSVMPDKIGVLVPESTKRELANDVEGIVGDIKTVIYDKITVMAVRAMAYIVTLIAVAIIVNIVFGLLDIVSRLPILHSANKLTGLALGLAEGIVIVWLLCGLRPVLAVYDQYGIKDQIEENAVLNYMSKNNLVSTLVNNKMSEAVEEITGFENLDRLTEELENGFVNSLDKLDGTIGDLVKDFKDDAAKRDYGDHGDRMPE